MPTKCEAHKLYTGRPEEVAVVNLSLDREAIALLKAFAPTKKAYGRFVSRLIYEHSARLDERQRIRGMLESDVEDAAV